MAMIPHLLLSLTRQSNCFKEELKLLMNSLGFYPSEQLIEQMIIDNDVDGDQLIDFEEFVQMAERYKKEEVATPHKGLRDAFKYFCHFTSSSSIINACFF